MTQTTAADLLPWNDPDDLLQSLYRVEKAPRPELRDALARLLEHDDPDVRGEALRILVTRWKDHAFRGNAAQTLRFDPDPEVRAAAAFALASVSADGDRLEDTQLLLEMLHDEAQEATVRGAAYDALLVLYRKPEFPTKKRDFDASLDVDWAWVKALEASLRRIE